jgi:predicted CoA-binding protein
MDADGLDDNQIRHVLMSTRRIALVGASRNPDRPANEIQRYLQARGYDVTPVNPGLAGEALLGRNVVATLDGAAPLEMVDVFRASEHVPAVVEDAIRLGALVVWMQLGVVHEAAAARARAAGLLVAMNRCPLIETRRLGLPPLDTAPPGGAA